MVQDVAEQLTGSKQLMGLMNISSACHTALAAHQPQRLLDKTAANMQLCLSVGASALTDGGQPNL